MLKTVPDWNLAKNRLNTVQKQTENRPKTNWNRPKTDWNFRKNLIIQITHYRTAFSGCSAWVSTPSDEWTEFFIPLGYKKQVMMIPSQPTAIQLDQPQPPVSYWRDGWTSTKGETNDVCMRLHKLRFIHFFTIPLSTVQVYSSTLIS